MRKMHIFFLLLVIVGALFLFHNYRSHGGWSGVKQGTGLGGGMMPT